MTKNKAVELWLGRGPSGMFGLNTFADEIPHDKIAAYMYVTGFLSSIPRSDVECRIKHVGPADAFSSSRRRAGTFVHVVLKR